LNVLQESNITRDYKLFVGKIKANDRVWLQEREEDLDFDNKKISLHFNGEVSPELEAQYRSDIKNYENIKDFDLDIYGNENRSVDKISDALDRAYKDLDRKDIIVKGLEEQITGLQQQVTNLQAQLESKASEENNNVVAFSSLSKEARIRYSDLLQFGYAKMLTSQGNFIQVDTIPVAAVKWNPELNDSTKTVRETELKSWLKDKLVLDTLIVERITQ
jgi:hypothetical protein